MEFPIYQVPFLGNGMVIGVNAIIHVLISHGFAIGLFGMIVLADAMAMGRSEERRRPWDVFNKRLLKFTVITTTVVGAMTGVGIWFTTTALAPRGIGLMLRIFFWAWFIEWIVFVLEVVAILLFYFYWDKLGSRFGRKKRIALGLSYMILAIMSAVIITGMLGFMLTSGDWPMERSFSQAFLNPSYFPQLFTRLGIAAVIGALTAMLFALFLSPKDRVFQDEASRLYGLILAITLPLLAIAVYTYYHTVPTGFIGRSLFSVLTGRLSQSPSLFFTANFVAIGCLVLIAISASFGRIRLTQWLMIPSLLFAIGLVAEFERVREFIRGPYLMPGHMYANTVLLQEEPIMKADGMLGHSYWYQHGYQDGSVITDGAFLFSANCSACHTINGINAIRDRVRGRSEDGIYVLVGRTDDMISFMPPFSGNDDERLATTRFLYELERGNVEMKRAATYTPRVEVAP